MQWKFGHVEKTPPPPPPPTTTTTTQSPVACDLRPYDAHVIGMFKICSVIHVKVEGNCFEEEYFLGCSMEERTEIDIIINTALITIYGTVSGKWVCDIDGKNGNICVGDTIVYY